MTRAGIALGSNLGDRLEKLSAAREQISATLDRERPLLASAIYETEPVDCEEGAGQFLNAVVEIGFDGSALELLHELRKLEARLGRPTAHAKNTSRTLDLDLLYFGDVECATADLQLPHPRMQERCFVLQPLADIRADLLLPGQTRSVAELLRSLPAAPPMVRIASEW